MEEQQYKSTRSLEEWMEELINIYTHRIGIDDRIKKLKEEDVKAYYDQGLSPNECFKQHFNK